ncbi:MAG: hypothetical protein JNL11_05055 [Bdellovibrionaceae bacterium]|nr:hypothetical protein [Pseudobdellovibrionaceae bacterium]
MEIKSELILLFERAFDYVQRGHASLPAIQEALAGMNGKISDEITIFFDSLHSNLRVGRDFLHILSTSDFFKDPSLRPEMALLEKSFLDPVHIKQYWLDWMHVASTLRFEDSSPHQFIQAFLRKKGPLWIVSEDERALNSILPSLNYRSSGKSFVHENYESILLQCQREKLQPAKAQLVLWVHSNSQDHAVVTGIDEVLGHVPGRADFKFQRIFQLRQNGKLAPTGVVPTAWSTFDLGDTIDTKIFGVR